MPLLCSGVCCCHLVMLPHPFICPFPSSRAGCEERGSCSDSVRLSGMPYCYNTWPHSMHVQCCPGLLLAECTDL